MGRTWGTGDVHGFNDIEKIEYFAQLPLEFTLEDVLIIAGDAGFIWYKDDSSLAHMAMCKLLNELPFTVFVVLGNHENYDKINKLQTTQQYGGRVRYNPQTPNVYYAERGEVYYINEKTYWCFGGADSIDKFRRIKHLSWWSEELPTTEEMEHGIKELIKCNRTVDYIITHDCPAQMFNQIPPHVLLGDKTIEARNINNYFDKIMYSMHYKKWYCAHWHFDGDLQNEWGDKIRFLYHNIVMIDEEY